MVVVVVEAGVWLYHRWMIPTEKKQRDDQGRLEQNRSIPYV